MADLHRFPTHPGTSRIVATRLDDGRFLVEFPDGSRSIIDSRLDLMFTIERWLADRDVNEKAQQDKPRKEGVS